MITLHKQPILFLIVLSSMTFLSSVSRAGLVIYSEGFDTQAAFITGNNVTSAGQIAANGPGATGADSRGRWIASNRRFQPSASNFTDSLFLDRNQGGNNYFGGSASVFIDLNGVTAGDYAITFDVSNYLNTDPGGPDNVPGSIDWLIGQGSNLDTLGGGNTLNFKTRTSSNSPADASDFGPFPEVTGGTAAGDFGILNPGGFTTVNGNGQQSLGFSLTTDGIAGDYLLLGFSVSAWDQNTVSANVDNILIQAIPEPSSASLLALSFPFFLRRRRGSHSH